MKGKRRERRKERGGVKGVRKGRRMPQGKETSRIDNSSRRQQQIFGGQRADGSIQMLTGQAPLESKLTHTAKPQTQELLA